MTSDPSSQSKANQFNFRAEIKQLLDILVHSLYKERDIFLRELISNASDALTQLQFEMLTNKEVLDPEAELAIHVDVVGEGDGKRLVIKDSGIGMTREEMITHLGTIAQSGAREFLKRVSSGEASPGEIIGRFGVGFYSLFMVAESVRVVSRSARPEAEAAAWISSGDETFRMEAADKQERGTELHLKLREDAAEYADTWKLKQIIKRHSDFIGFPIYVAGEQANQQQSLWRKRPGEVAQSDYTKFYQQLTLDFEEPLLTIHLVSDAPVDVRGLLFIPNKREKGFLTARAEPGLKLYSHHVLIQEYCQDLLPKWLNFIDGVVDSEDLPLNVSRETVQNNRLMRQLSKTLRHRVLRDLARLAEEDTDKYNHFWRQFGRTLKEGLVTDPEASNDVLPLFRFYSSRSNGGLRSLDQVINDTAEGQTEIYFVYGDDLDSVAHSPHLDPFKARNLEVLYWIDPIDPFLTPVLRDYKDKKFRNVDDPLMELPPLAETAAKDPAKPVLPEVELNRFVGRCVTTLGDRVTEVRVSKVLKDSPVRLVSPDNLPNRELQRVYRYMDQEYKLPKKIFEVNRDHPFIVQLAKLVTNRPDAPFINLAIEQLFASALVQEGLHPNPVEMLPRIQAIMELAAAG
ncbi:MAG: molecular chaperone HtpG [Chloroflexota bacterium]